MWLLAKPSVQSVRKQLSTALTYADDTPVYDLTAGERTDIQAAYALYDRQQGRPHANLIACGLTPACLKALHTAYGEVQKGGRLKRLRQTLLDGAEECPLCGFGEPTQLDHYLPRDSYRVLSIYPRNLIPSCGPCNNAKRKHVGGAANEFVHAYFDDLPAIDFLAADIEMTGAALKIEFRIEPTGLDPDLAASLDYQFGRLNLKSRYKKQANLFLFAQRTALLKAHAAQDGAEFRATLRKTADGLDDDFGRNDWRAALMRGLAACDTFCDGGIGLYFAKRRRPPRRSAI